MSQIAEIYDDFIIQADSRYLPEKTLWQPTLVIISKSNAAQRLVLDDIQLAFENEAEAQKFSIEMARKMIDRKQLAIGAGK